MKNEFQELVDRDLSGLVWDERMRRKALSAVLEEEKTMMKRKVSAALICAIMLIMAAVTAVASGVLFSGEVDAVKLADEALHREYGITSEMQTYFRRSVMDNGGHPLVCYESFDNFIYVLGNYYAVIKDGKAEVRWSRDGAITAGGFDADAWGAEQLAEMLRINRETNSMSPYAEKAAQIAASHGIIIDSTAIPTAETIEALQRRQQENAEKARSAAKLSLTEMETHAREALALRYNLSQDQICHLAWYEESSYYMMYNEEKPCYEFYFALGYDEDGYQGAGSGIYMAAVNVEPGVVENLIYDSGLGGNG